MTKVDDAVLAARVVLSWLAEPGNEDLHQLVAAEGPVGALDAILGGGIRGSFAGVAKNRLRDRGPEEIAEELFGEATRLGVRIIVPESPEWPSTLDDLSRISKPVKERFERDTYPPHALWIRGGHRLDTLTSRSVAIVGARDCSDYGAHVAAEFAYGLAARGWTVISGGAHGIDASAHRGCLASQGKTIAVLACGVDRPYPPSNTGMFEQIAKDGLVISEWPPGTDPHRYRFIIRNRVIAALARGTVLVEASLRSGGRNTLRRARELSRPAMVVPGRITSVAAAGCHEELRRDADDRARLVARVEHILEEVGDIGTDLSPVERGAIHPRDALDGVEQQLVDAAPIRPVLTAPQLAARAGVGLLDALAAIPSLVLRGHLRDHGDGTYSVALNPR